MKKFTREYHLTFSWWREDGEPIIDKHVIILDRVAKTTANKKLEEGIFEGELLQIILYGRQRYYVRYVGTFNHSIITSE